MALAQTIEAPAARGGGNPAFTPTRKAGLARLEAAARSLGRHYRDTRNGDLGPDDRSNVSVLSPWITHRLLSEREVLERVLADHDRGSAEQFIAEVFWRAYFKGWLEMRPWVWRAYAERRDRALAAVADNGGMHRDYTAAIEGRTGIEGFDDWAREIVATGYLHNHARMWFASIWMHTLRLDWTLGADFFLRHLLDGDAASNTLSWRWVGGLHTRGKVYAARRDNIARNTGGRFSPSGLHEDPGPLPDDGVDTAPEPIGPLPPVPGGRAVLMVHPADCAPEQLSWPGVEVAAVAGLVATADRSPLPVSDDVLAFAQGAVRDGIARNAARLGCDSTMVGDAAGLVRFAGAVGADHIVAPYAPVGETRDLLDRVRSRAAREGIGLHERRRDWDTRAWPHATKGFFKLKQRIPQLLRDAGL